MKLILHLLLLIVALALLENSSPAFVGFGIILLLGMIPVLLFDVTRLFGAFLDVLD